MREAAEITHDDSLKLTISTDAPAVHVYTGRWNPWYKGDRHGPFSGIAVEPERYVDAVNREEWRSWVVLKEGEEYS
jgi:galactose mutarotase-like enzyme